jgi:lipopolysaccharide transport system ATP-binding protein
VLAVGDAAFQRQCLAKVDELRSAGCAVMIVSHDLELISTHCQDVAVLTAGEVTALGPTERSLAIYREQAGGDVSAADQPVYRARGKTLAARRLRGA